MARDEALHGSTASMAAQVHALEKRLITAALKDNDGIIYKAAAALGFNHHQSLVYLLDARHKNLRHLCAKPRRLRSIIRKR